MFRVISRLKKLTFLNISNLLHRTEVDDSSCSTEDNKFSCGTFDYYGEESMKILRDLPDLTRLHLDNFKMTDSAFEIFGTFTNLLELKLSNFKKQINPMVKLSKNTNLKKLYLDIRNITKEDIVAISKLKKLENIFIRDICHCFSIRAYFKNFDNIKEAVISFDSRRKFGNGISYCKFRFPKDLY